MKIELTQAEVRALHAAIKMAKEFEVSSWDNFDHNHPEDRKELSQGKKLIKTLDRIDKKITLGQ